MNNNLHKRLKEIEDRKIEILQEISEINMYYRERISRLSSEFEQLDEEYYNLRLKLIGHKEDIS
jgi:hypothetical protein